MLKNLFNFTHSPSRRRTPGVQGCSLVLFTAAPPLPRAELTHLGVMKCLQHEWVTLLCVYFNTSWGSSHPAAGPACAGQLDRHLCHSVLAIRGGWETRPGSWPAALQSSGLG